MAIAMTLVSCNKQGTNTHATNNDLSTYGLKGNVKQCIVHTMNGMLTTELNFNKQGFLTKKVETYNDCTPIVTTLFDGAGNVTETSFRQQCDSVWHVDQTDLIEEYDAADRLKRVTYLRPDNGDTIEIETYDYDANGNLTSFKRLNAMGKHEYKEQNTYDQNGNCIEMTWDAQTAPETSYFIYNAANQPICERICDATGTEMFRCEKSYDDVGRLSYCKDYDGLGNLRYEQHYTYNADSSYTRTATTYTEWQQEIGQFGANGFMTEYTLYYQPDTVALHATFRYEPDGQTLNSVTIVRNGQTTTESFNKTDAQGNVISKAVGPTDFFGAMGFDVQPITREITYY